MKNNTKGLISVAIAALLFGISPAFSKILLSYGLTSANLVFISHAINGALNLILAVCFRKKLLVSAGAFLRFFIIGALGMGCTTFFLNLAYSSIGVGLTTVIHFLYPAVIVVIMRILYNQKITKRFVLSILISLFGMAIISGSSYKLSIIGIMFAFASCLTYSLYLIFNEKGRFAEISAHTKMLYMALGSSCFFGAVSLAEPISYTQSPKIFLFLCVIGICSGAGYFFLVSGIKLIGARKAAFGTMLEPVTGLAVGALALDEKVTAAAAIGCIIILLSVFFVIQQPKDKEAS